MEAVATFLAMGGYARFVWPSFALTAVVLTVLAVASVRSLRLAEAELRALEGGPSRAECDREA